MSQKDAKAKIRKLFLEGYKKITKSNERIKFLKTLIDRAEEQGLESYVFVFRGNQKWIEKDFAAAIECFDKAIALDNKFADPWNGLGNVYRQKNEYDKAIAAYNTAIALDDKFAYPWNELGDIYCLESDFDKAIEAYNKAIELDDKFAYPWAGLGDVYVFKNDYDKAIEAYNKAIELDNRCAHFYRNLALYLLGMKRYEDAKNNFQIALSLFKDEGDHYFVSITESNIEHTQSYIKFDHALKTKEKRQRIDPTARILKETINKKIEEKALKYQKTFLEFICERKDDARDDIYFQVLRRWNSYTPIIADNYHISKGGGYFVKTATKGIVIDPGFNFIDNFKGAGHHFYEIDAVLLTHAHNDHTADLESILTLLFKYNEVIKGLDDPTNEKTVLAEIAKRKNSSPSEVSQKEVEDEFLKSSRRKTLDIYLTSSVFKKYSGMLNLFSSNDYRIHVIEKGSSFEIDGVQIEVVGAKHYDIISDRDSVGFVLAFEKTLLVYTGDTGWNEEIEGQYRDLAKRYKDHTRLLVAHLGGFKEYEKFYLDTSTRSKSFYKNHLGRIGLAKINEALRPNVCFISEFGEELKHARIELAEIFQTAFNDEITFMPADIGLKYQIKNNKVDAITGIDVEENSLSYGDVEPADVQVCLMRKDFSLHYYKKGSHALKESDLMQILQSNFDTSTTK